MIKIRAYVQPTMGIGHRLVLIRDKIGTGKVDVLRDFVWEEMDEGGLLDHFAGVPRADDLIQGILDEAWEAGFRPRGFADVKNETSALREHLADMKQIAFHQLKIT